MVVKLNQQVMGGKTLPVYLNPDHIVYLEGIGAGHGTRIYLTARSQSGESRTLSVAENPDAVAGLCNKAV
ncbi:MAG: hypothetical protein F4Y04_00365 [Chloroflexi bacterium]|nr:hypothetical protein [Chloroflexota bacterium]